MCVRLKGVVPLCVLVRTIVRFVVYCLVELLHIFSCKHTCMQVFFFFQKNVIFSYSSSRFSSFKFQGKTTYFLLPLFSLISRSKYAWCSRVFANWKSTSLWDTGPLPPFFFFERKPYLRFLGLQLHLYQHHWPNHHSWAMARARPSPILVVGQFNEVIFLLLLFLTVSVRCART